MFAKGNPHNDGPYLARYLATESKGTERAEMAELRGFASDNIFDAFALGQLMASGTRCENPFFHVYVRLPKEEALSREQWQQAADFIEMQLGFDDQPRAMVFHLKDGGEHMHLVWSRIDQDTLRAIDPGLYKNKLREIARILEKEFGLRQIGNKRDPDQKTKSASRPEEEQSRRLKTDLKEIRETIRECWDMSDNGRSFTAALEEKGLILAQGDKRDFVIVDHAGGLHALGKRITGATAQDTRDRLADLDKKQLPDIDQAKAWQREREKSLMPDQKGLGMKKRKKEAIAREEEWKQEAIQKEEDRKREEGEKEENRKLQAGLDEERRKEEAMKEEARKQESIREEQQKEAAFKEENLREQAREQVELQKSLAEDMEVQQQLLSKFRENLRRMVEEARKAEAQRSYETEQAAAAKELFIRDANSRYSQALAQHYDMRNPYSSLARSAMAEHGAFLRDRENIDRQIARTTDPMERKALELQKRIEYADYMAITSNRIAQQSDIVWGKKVVVKENGKEIARMVSAEGEVQRSKADEFQKEAQELRKEYRELQKTRLMEAQPEAPQKSIARPHLDTPEHAKMEKRHETKPRFEERPPKSPTTNKPQGPEIMVEERVRGEKNRKTLPFSEFMKTVKSEQPPQTVTHQDMKQDPSLRSAYFKNVAFEQKRSLSLERIQEDLKLGRNLNAADLHNLTRDELQKVRHWGHEHLKTIVQEHTRQRDLDRER